MRRPIASWSAAAVLLLSMAWAIGQASAESSASTTQSVPSATSPWSSALAESPQGDLTSISCPVPNFCMAIDSDGNVVTYNGTTWSAPRLVDPDLPGTNPVISCISATFCVVVDAAGGTVIYHEATWSKPTLIDPYKGLDAVSCVSASFCLAVDISGYVFVYNGTSWSPAHSLIEPSEAGLVGVSCTSVTFCMVLGKYDDSFAYNGTSWTSFRVPTGSSFIMTGLSCYSSAFCMAVAQHLNVGAAPGADVFDGKKWTSMDMGTTFPGQLSALFAVSCWSATQCLAVGEAIASYNGTTETWLVRPNQGQLDAVSCDPEGTCIAVDRDGVANVQGSGLVSVDPPSGLGLDSVSCRVLDFLLRLGRGRQRTQIRRLRLEPDRGRWRQLRRSERHLVYDVGFLRRGQRILPGRIRPGDDLQNSWGTTTEIDPNSHFSKVSRASRPASV